MRTVFAGRTGDTALAGAAREAFTSAMSTAFAVSAAGVPAAAVLAFLVLRERRVPAPGPEPAPEGATAQERPATSF
ncbi:hypothetical protein ACLQ2P_24005 [Actinomadura citrea]|uniref:hypothetical protein n=1 Tax=Actinomadura citrea TaxID=46158 RepID=UPI003CE47919